MLKVKLPAILRWKPGYSEENTFVINALMEYGGVQTIF